MRLRLLAPLAAGSALLYAPVHAQFYTPPPDWARAKAPEAADYDLPISPVPHWYEVRHGSWQVPLETVHHIVSLVDARLGSNKLFGDKARIAKYAIQYRGETRQGRQIVRLAGACRLDPSLVRELSAEFVDVNDGGECYFDAVYDPVERRLSDFRYHGYG